MLQADADSFAEPSQLDNLFLFRFRDWRRGRAQQKRRRELNSLQRVTENPLFKRLDVDDDVGKLRHSKYEINFDCDDRKMIVRTSYKITLVGDAQSGRAFYFSTVSTT
jgi:hypothetical protein